MERAVPGSIAHDENWRGAGICICGNDAASEERRDAIKFERIGSYACAEELIGLRAVVGEDKTAGHHVADDVFKDAILLTDGSKLREGKGQSVLGSRLLRIANNRDDEASAVFGGEGVEEEIVEDAEDDGTGADAEGQGEDSDKGELRILAQVAQCVSNVAEQGMHLPLPSCLFSEERTLDRYSSFVNSSAVSPASRRILFKTLGCRIFAA